MTRKRVGAAIALVLLACACTMVFNDLAYAQQGATDSQAAKTSDKKVATRRGVNGALADGAKDDAEGPTKVQMAIGVGSVIVAIAVVKWL